MGRLLVLRYFALLSFVAVATRSVQDTERILLWR